MNRLSERFWGIWGLSLYVVAGITAAALVAVWLLPTQYNRQIESSALVLAAIMIGWSAWQSRSVAYSTSQQTKVSSRMAQEMQESRLASLQPIIVMGRSPASVEPPNVNIVVEQTTIKHRTYLYNVGPGPALNLCFLIREPNRKNPSGTFSGKELRALGPGEVYELDLKNTFSQMRLSSNDLMVEYEDIFGRKWRSGLELNYTQGQQELTVLKLFYEKLD